jgi:Bardet-Biedl syndrome 1 protein
VPVFIQCVGMFDIEYRIIVACRNGKIYTVKKGKLITNSIIELESHPCGLLVIPRCDPQSVHTYECVGMRAYV